MARRKIPDVFTEASMGAAEAGVLCRWDSVRLSIIADAFSVSGAFSGPPTADVAPRSGRVNRLMGNDIHEYGRKKKRCRIVLIRFINSCIVTVIGNEPAAPGADGLEI
jgi:hypothetical protein